MDKVSGVSGFVLPGDRVDVIASIDRYGADNDAIATTVLQNVEVLAAGEKTEQQNNKVIESQAVTLLVDGEGKAAQAVERTEAGDAGFGSAIAIVLLLAVVPVMIYNLRQFRAREAF